MLPLPQTSGIGSVCARRHSDKPTRLRVSLRHRPRCKFAMARLFSGLAAVLICATTFAAKAGADSVPTEKVTFSSNGLALVGYLYRPEGTGPWPAVVWNHGSERDPQLGVQFDAVAAVFVPAGYIVFAPARRGHGESEGRYNVDRSHPVFQRYSKAEANRGIVQLLESERLDDQLAALAYLKQQPFVDKQRLAVAGCSFGGIQALLGAQSRLGYRAAISISPGAPHWGSRPLRELLLEAVAHIDIPVLLLQPPKDTSLEPSRVLGAAAAQLGKPLTAKVYPPTGPEEEQTHCFGGAKGMHVWAADAAAFLDANLGNKP
jgi:carboxymethylenebutenolidase